MSFHLASGFFHSALRSLPRPSPSQQSFMLTPALQSSFDTHHHLTLNVISTSLHFALRPSSCSCQVFLLLSDHHATPSIQSTLRSPSDSVPWLSCCTFRIPCSSKSHVLFPILHALFEFQASLLRPPPLPGPMHFGPMLFKFHAILHMLQTLLEFQAPLPRFSTLIEPPPSRSHNLSNSMLPVFYTNANNSLQ